MFLTLNEQIPERDILLQIEAAKELRQKAKSKKNRYDAKAKGQNKFLKDEKVYIKNTRISGNE